MKLAATILNIALVTAVLALLVAAYLDPDLVINATGAALVALALAAAVSSLAALGRPPLPLALRWLKLRLERAVEEERQRHRPAPATRTEPPAADGAGDHRERSTEDRESP